MKSTKTNKKSKKKKREGIRSLRKKFVEKNEILKNDFQLTQVSADDFLRFIFPYGQQEKSTGRNEQGSDRHPNAILNSIKDPEYRGWTFNRILFDDFEVLRELKGHQFVITSPVGFFGKSRKAANAFTIYGIAIDLDYVEINNLRDLIFQMINNVIPVANFIVNSGTGLHVYYIFETPVPAYEHYKIGLSKLKTALTKIVWNTYTSSSDKRQFQGIFQGYRVPETQTKLGKKYLVTAFQFNRNKISFDYLNDFIIDEKYHFHYDEDYLTIEAAKQLYPEWYQRRIIEEREIGDYALTESEKKRRRAWYESWKKRLKKGAYDGNRFYCIGILFNYAMKAGIPLDEVREDALTLVPFLNSLTEDETNEFTEDDVFDAEMYYDRKFIKIGREFILRKTKIDIGITKRSPPEKRIRRKPLPEDPNRNCNLKARAWGVRDVLYPNGSWRNSDGRPKGAQNKSKSAAYRRVADFIAEHSEETNVSKIAKDAGASRGTVYRVLKDIEIEKKKKLTEDDVIIGFNSDSVGVSDEIKKAAAQMMNDFKK